MKEWRILMEWIKPRPCVEAALAMMIGSLCAYFFSKPTPWSGLFALIIVLILSCIVFIRNNQKNLRIIVCIIYLLSGFGLASSSLWTTASFDSSHKGIVHATVKRLLSSGENFRVLLLEDGVSCPNLRILPGYGRLTLRNNNLELTAGDRIAFTSTLRRPSNRGNPGEYNWELDCLNEGIVWLASARDENSVVALYRSGPYDPEAIIYNLRKSMLGFLETYSGKYFRSDQSDSIRAILKGIVLGDRGEISPETNRSFSDSGLVHMFSASGVHVTIVGLMAFYIVKSVFWFRPEWLLRVPLPVAASLAAMPTISIYCVLVGFKPPSMRATIMGLVLAVSVLSQKRWDSLNTLTFASILIIMIYPLSFLTPGFQLSFAAALGIVMLIGSEVSVSGKSVHEGISTDLPSAGLYMRGLTGIVDFLRRPLLSIMIVTVGATIATGPIVAQLFQRIPIYGVFANLLAEIPLSLALTLGLMATFVSSFSADLGAVLLFPAEVCVWFVLILADFFSSLPGAVLNVPEVGIAGLIVSIAVVILFFLLLRIPSRKTLLSLFAGLALLFMLSLASFIRENSSNTLTATFLNVGNGDSAFVKPPQTDGFLVDGGPRTDFFDAGQSIIAPFFLFKSVRRLDAVVVSHPQADHVGGIYSAIKQAPTSRIFINRIHIRSEYTFLQQITGITQGLTISKADNTSLPCWIGEAKLTFMNPPLSELGGKLSGRNVNDSSAVMRMDYKDFSILFLGDLEKSGEIDLLTSGLDLRATVLKVAHHAGKTSATSKELLERVKPKIAIVSADFPPRGGIPNQETIERLEQVCRKVYWTGRDGALTVSSTGSGPTRVLLGKTGKTEIVD